MPLDQAYIAQCEREIAALEAAGVTVTYRTLFPKVRGNKGRFTTFMRQRQAQQGGGAVVAVPRPGPTPPVASVPPQASRLVTLQHQVGALEDEVAKLHDAEQRATRALAEARAAYRNTLSELRRLVPLCRKAVLPALVRLDPVGQAKQAQQLTEQLAALVGSEEARRVMTDGHYDPWWFTAR